MSDINSWDPYGIVTGESNEGRDDMDSEPSSLVSRQEEHFELFCLVMERGFALHTGSSNHLVVNYRLSETSRTRFLPKVHPYGGASYRIPERWLKPSDLYLYFDPPQNADIPQLAYYHPASGAFTPFDHEAAASANQLHQPIPLPVAKLASLKGLHYIKDAVCLQLYELDFERLFQADAFVAEHIRTALAEKMANFVEFSRPWLNASRYEQAARDCLDPDGEQEALAQASRYEQAALDCLRNYRPGHPSRPGTKQRRR